MKHVAQSLTLGLAVLAASTVSPRAADFAVGSGGVIKDFGSIKDYRNAAVPVPAPTPSYAANKDWYVRADLGYTFATNADVTTYGGVSAYPGADLGSFLFGSLGFGRYITPSLRAELSLDLRPKKTVTTGTQTFTKYATQTRVDSTTGLATNDGFKYTVTQQDNSQEADQTAFINLYYDFHTPGSRFTPYVGAGIGLDSRRYKRATSQTVACAQQSVDATTTTIYKDTCPNSPYGSPPTPGGNDDKYTADFGFAGAVMVGASYEVTPGVQLDAGYRLLWEGASLSLDARSFDGNTKISISDKLDHELRTGVRIDLN